MTRIPRALLVCLLLLGIAATVASPVATRARKFNVLVFTDRDQPDSFVPVSDLVVNETAGNSEGDRFLTLQSAQGTFQLPFELIAEVEFTKYVGAPRPDTARYEARVVLPTQGVRRGTIDLRVLRGFVQDAPWHDLLSARPDRGARLHRILFVGAY